MYLTYKLIFFIIAPNQISTFTPVRDKILFIKKLVVSQIFCTFIGDLQQVTNIFDLTTDYKVTELFCIIDEFCKHFMQKMQEICWMTIAE